MTNIIKNLVKEYKLEKYLTKKYFDYGLVVFPLLLGFYLRWDAQNVVLFPFIIWIILNPVSSRFLARIALYCLAFVPFLLIIHRENRAEQFAIFAFYFLVLTVITTIIEFKKGQIIVTSASRKKN